MGQISARSPPHHPIPPRIAADRLATAARPETVRDILTTYADQLTAAHAFTIAATVLDAL